MPKLSKSNLMQEVFGAILESGWTPLLIERTHPFLVRASNPDGARLDLRVYIWNCTPGGANRSPDEFRIQFTSTVPVVDPHATTLLLGWHDENATFIAWDISKHDGQASNSPSAQVKEGTIAGANDNAFATQRKDNEVVIAFRPAFFMDYARARSSLHATGAAEADTALLNHLPALTDAEIDGVGNAERRRVIRMIATRFRARDFRDRVLSAYGHSCAFCRVQLSLLDAAHILPVAAPGSTDEIVNGVALCKIHHFAYDAKLVSFSVNYEIQVSAARLAELAGRHGGLRAFRTALGTTLSLPARVADHPRPSYIRASRRIRGWRD